MRQFSSCRDQGRYRARRTQKFIVVKFNIFAVIIENSARIVIFCDNKNDSMNLAPAGCDDIPSRKRLILLLRAKI